MSPQRTLWSDLRAIDQAIVPRVAAVLARLRRAARAAADSVDGGTGGPVTRMRRLDHRYARRGVLGLVGDVPQVGAVGLALLLTVAAVTAAVRIGHTPSQDNTAPDLPAVSSSIATVGPLPNEDIRSYLAAAQAALGQQAAQDPGQQIYAIVDFESPKTPADAAAAVPGVSPQLIYVEVKVPGAKQTFPSTAEQFSAYAPLKSALRLSSLDDAHGAFESLAGALERAAGDNTTFADSIGAGASPEDLAQKEQQLADARHYRAEATALRGDCACIYAVVVYGAARTLSRIVDSGKVRVVDPASPGLKLSEIRWTPLLPETKTRQPAASAGP